MHLDELLEKLSWRFRSVFLGIFGHSVKSVVVRSDSGVGWESLSTVHCLAVMFSQEEAICKRLPQSWENEIIQNVLVFEHYEFLSLELMRQCYVPRTAHYAVGQMCHTKDWQTQTHPLDCQTKNNDASFHRKCLHCSGVQWLHALHYCIRQFILYLKTKLGFYSLFTETHSTELSWQCSSAKLKAIDSRKLVTSMDFVDFLQRGGCHAPAPMGPLTNTSRQGGWSVLPKDRTTKADGVGAQTKKV